MSYRAENVLRLYNTLTRKIELFQSANGKAVKMYTCGPSTYQRQHIGNYRTFLFEDLLQRYLEYLGFKVTRLVAITDIEDKAIACAKVADLSIDELTERNEAIFFEESAQLRIKRPQYSVHASTIVDESVKLIKEMVEKEVAYSYVYKGAKNVYFDPFKFKGFGKLANLDMKQWPKKRRRFHLDTYPGMPWNKGDFVLWHGCRNGDRVCWDTDFGRGRPAWNIQDASMVTKHLGFSIDVACGGIDNLVRHHDYTLAIAEAISGKSFARYWLHGGHLFVDGKKMSKSKGNALYIEDLTAKNYQAEHIRFFLIYGAYREKQNFTWQKLAETSKKLDSLKTFLAGLRDTENIGSSATEEAERTVQSILPLFEKHMNDNLDIKSAFDSVYAIVVNLCKLKNENRIDTQQLNNAISDLRKIDSVLQTLFV